MGPNPLPLPSYLIFLLGQRKSNYAYRYIPVLLALVARLVAGRMVLPHSKKRHMLSTVFVALSMLGSKISPGTNAHFTELFVFLAIEAIMSSSCLQSSCYLGLALCCDSSGLALLCAASLRASQSLYAKMIDPRNSSKTIIRECLKAFALIIIAPACIFLASAWLDLMIRDRHSIMSLSYSIPFQSSLRDFDVQKGFSGAHSEMVLEKPSETFEYVMDRSIVSLLSKKHKSFFQANGTVLGSNEPVHFCEIHKIHETDFDTEEPRFIKNGDYVKFKDLSKDTFVGVERKDPDAKFIDLSLRSFENDEDLWEVECDGYLRARSAEVRFRNVKSGDYLNARKIKNTSQLTGSYYSETSSRVFFIASNENHEYYRLSFEDTRARSIIKSLPKSSRMALLSEYIRSIKFGEWGSPKSFMAELREHLLNVSIGCVVALSLVLNEISKNRYGTSVKTTEKTCFLAMIFALLAIKTIMMGTTAMLIGSMSHALLASFASDLYSTYIERRSVKVHLRQTKNK